MKATAQGHPKIRRLRRALNLREYEAVGVLEMIWQFTAQHAPRGDIGRWADEDIAGAIDWPEERASELIEALIDAQLLDVSEDARLVVHDWHDHAQDNLKQRLQSVGETWATTGEPVFRTAKEATEWREKNGEPRRTSENLGETRRIAEDRGGSRRNSEDRGGSRRIAEKNCLPKPMPKPKPIIKSESYDSLSASESKEALFEKEVKAEELCAWWNAMKQAGIVAVGVSAKPTKTVRESWRKARGDPDRREYLRDLGAIREQIEKSPFVNAGWFDLPKLLNGKNSSGEWVIVRLMNGGYRDEAKGGAPKLSDLDTIIDWE
jgi:hypothetical protein